MKIYFMHASDFSRSTVKEKYPELDWVEEYCETSNDLVDKNLDKNNGKGKTWRDVLNEAVEKEKYLCTVHANPADHYFRWKLWEKSARFYLNLDSLENLADIQKIIKEKFILSFDQIRADEESPEFAGCGPDEGSLGRPGRENGTGLCTIYDGYIE